ncbi:MULTISPECIES: hypothetical protein [Methylophaga]|mgnify:FL=1|jgi:hypothetical protein|uniref:Uncharacterized protein n=1 Tax=Methylophaga aminisulfidivorans MP TaxID=1026882 RepID=F5T0Q7_9GAMM|nr:MULTISPECIES: hypothetical protein [Methylophaga]EGL53861.1 hypothetical protein MAMP_00108 [Methylophaga aminisulfidivorans MP]HIC45542.1 hypothetical protein [Methylophaga sp.]|tara:strand:+ start:94 stop:441 length:348 start_codon:yes stop_codon:yes gene_type:complete
MKTPTPPVFSYTLQHYAGHHVLCITDDFDNSRPSITVTNTAEYVLKDIANEIGQLPELIIYRDTQGHWDRMLMSQTGTFIRIEPIVSGLKVPVLSQDTAVQLAVTSTANSLSGVA